MKAVITAVLALVLLAGPAFADSVHIGGTTNITNQGGQGGAGGAGGSAASAASASSVNTNVNTNVNTQGQQQGQHQGQIQGQQQGQGQGQKQEANNAGNSQHIKVESSLIPGVAVAPGLAAGGSQVCLGSFSVGLSGPMAGIAFGKTVLDKGCEDRQNAILLYNMGYKAEALELLKGGNERVKALFPETKKVSALPDTQLKLQTVLGSEAPTYRAPLTEPDVVVRPDGSSTSNFGRR